MNIRAKFQVQSVMFMNPSSSIGRASCVEDHQAVVTLTAVHGNDNRMWSKWTPSGELRMAITNPEAYRQFAPGLFVFLDITEAPEKESDEK